VSIQCFGEAKLPAPAPVTFLSPTSGDELLAWLDSLPKTALTGVG
jgi:hypothetical protein